MEEKNTMQRKVNQKLRFFVTILIAYTLTLTITISTSGTSPTDTDEYITVFYPSQDTSIDQTAPNQNYGNDSTLRASNTYGNQSSGWQRDILLCMNISALPATAQITSATLALYYYEYDVTDPVNRVLSLHQLTTDWDEDTVTWNTRPTAVHANISFTYVPASAGWMTWELTGEIQRALNAPSENHGWQISDKNPYRHTNIPISKFKSQETQTKFAPNLEVHYIIPLSITTTGPFTGHTNETITMNSTITAGGTPPYSWRWEFGDEETSTEQSPTHIYTASGRYTVTLTVSDSIGKTGATTTSATITENSTKPVITIQQPQNGLYLYNKKIVLLQKSIIIGPIDISVQTSSTNPIIKVKFFLDNELQYIDTTAPFTWTMKMRTCWGRHVIKVIAVDTAESSCVDSQTVWKLF